MVPEKDKSRLNMLKNPDKYPLPNMQDLSNCLHNCKTAIITPFDLFEYLFISFGLSNATQTFERMMVHYLQFGGCVCLSG
jgi:hypothetical protein